MRASLLGLVLCVALAWCQVQNIQLLQKPCTKTNYTVHIAAPYNGQRLLHNAEHFMLIYEVRPLPSDDVIIELLMDGVVVSSGPPMFNWGDNKQMFYQLGIQAFAGKQTTMDLNVRRSDEFNGTVVASDSVTFSVAARTSVISIFPGAHDCNIAVTFDGELKVVLEIERLFGIRYLGLTYEDNVQFVEQLKQAVDVVNAFVGMTGATYDVGVFVRQVNYVQTTLVAQTVRAARWVDVDHHSSHAAMGFYDSPFDTALVFSYDSGGNDGVFNVYKGDREHGLNKVWDMPQNMGELYNLVASFLVDVSGPDYDIQKFSWYHHVSLSGKLMAYAGLGQIRPDWVKTLTDAYTAHSSGTLFCAYKPPGWTRASSCSKDPHSFFPTAFPGINVTITPEGFISPLQDARDFAASNEYAFEQYILRIVHEQLQKHSEVEGVVMVGGCGLNVKTNQAVCRSLKGSKLEDSVHVPAAPNDGGLSVGAAWLIVPPPAHLRGASTQFTGLPLFDEERLPEFIAKRGARPVSIDDVADILAGGAIIALVRGRQEFGPRSLGHRSLLAYPDSDEVKKKLNQIKRRQWYRPVAPMVAVEAVNDLFIDACQSPYMSFAPALREEAKKAFPAITHFDGTARVQSVRSTDDAYMHELLLAVGRRRGTPILANTSFNTRGEPILNKIADAMDLLDEGSGMDYVVIEGWLFQRGVAGDVPQSWTGMQIK